MRKTPKSLLLFAGVLVFAVSASWGGLVYVKRVQKKRVWDCMENLSNIDGAKQLWALEKDMPATAVPTWEILIRAGYLSEESKCPSGGEYEVLAINEFPTCSLAWRPQLPHCEFAYHSCGHHCHNH